MTFTTTDAKRLKPFFEALAQFASVNTTGVKLSVSKRHRVPESVGNQINLPLLDKEPMLYVSAFLHELQHVRDFLDGISVDLDYPEAERRAQRAERKIPGMTKQALVEWATEQKLFRRGST